MDNRKEKKHKKEKKDRKEKKSKRSKRVKERISSDDYYSKAPEFRYWLVESQAIYFDDLSSKEARAYFNDFIDSWNAGLLRSEIYDGIPESQSNVRTRFKWGFTKNMDREQMNDVRKDIYRATNPRIKNEERESRGEQQPQSERKRRDDHRGQDKVDEEDREKREEEERSQRKKELKVHRKRKEMTEEELVPKETGREAMIEKKRQKSSYTKMTKEDNDFEMGDSQMYGDDGDSFKRRVERQKMAIHNRMQEKQDAANQKIEEYNKKEQERMAPFHAMIRSGMVPLLREQPPN